MTIYKVGADYDTYKFFVFENDSEYIEAEGESLKTDWRPRRLTLFTEPPKRKDKRREDFDVSCYFSGLLFVNHRVEKILQSVLGEQAEFLPVIIDGRADEFVYVNSLGDLDAINGDGLDHQAYMKLFRANKLRFRLDVVGTKLLFRASKSSLYYCTPAFTALAEEYQIKGLRFEAMGEAS